MRQGTSLLPRSRERPGGAEKHQLSLEATESWASGKKQGFVVFLFCPDLREVFPERSGAPE